MTNNETLERLQEARVALMEAQQLDAMTCGEHRALDMIDIAARTLTRAHELLKRETERR